MISIRAATDEDIEGLYRVAEDMQVTHERHYYERCLSEQEEKKRVALVAAQNYRLLGYVQLVWVPIYSTFRRLDISRYSGSENYPRKTRSGHRQRAC